MISLEDATTRYGAITNGAWTDESKWCELLQLPPSISAALINSATGKPTAHIYCNKDISKPLIKALCLVRDRGLLSELKTFDGCFMIRSKRGSDVLSTHAYALAIDLNAATNILGGPSTLSVAFIACFTECGFLWGGTFKRSDPMHFQIAGW